MLSNIEHTRFGNSPSSLSSFSNSRFAPHESRFERPQFGGRNDFHGGERFGRRGFGGGRDFYGGGRGFVQESSFGGDGFSFFPDLLDLALSFGRFGSPGFGLIGLGANLLESAIGADSGYGGGSGGYGDYGGYGGDPGSYGGYDAGSIDYGTCTGDDGTLESLPPYGCPVFNP
ncbi:MAG: hypothetical protein ACRD5M_07905 [Candidatus Acidiferrales bacterium]